MKKISGVLFSTLTGLALATMLVALPSNAGTPKHQDPAQQQQTQVVSGKIASFDKTSLTISLGTANSVSTATQTATPSSMTFTIDKNTTVEGKLKVGSTADVTYRQDNGNNVAISVHVS